MVIALLCSAQHHITHEIVEECVKQANMVLRVFAFYEPNGSQHPKTKIFLDSTGGGAWLFFAGELI